MNERTERIHVNNKNYTQHKEQWKCSFSGLIQNSRNNHIRHALLHIFIWKKKILCFLLILDTYTSTPTLTTTITAKRTIRSIRFNSISYIGWEYIHFFYKSLWRIQLKYLNALNDFVISYVSKCFVLIKFQSIFLFVRFIIFF